LACRRLLDGLSVRLRRLHPRRLDIIFDLKPEYGGGGMIVKKEIHMVNSNEQKATDDLKTIAPEFAKLTQDLLFGDIWERPGLSQRDKSLITVTCLVALNRIEQVDFHLKKAFENGLTKEELVAAITHIAFSPGGPPRPRGLVT
jgi:4-carboxymuconolactone decarboxylase